MPKEIARRLCGERQYYLNELRRLALDRLAESRFLWVDAIAFFQIACSWFSSVAISDPGFKRRFAILARNHLKGMSPQQWMQLTEILVRGGYFASKVCVLLAEESFREPKRNPRRKWTLDDFDEHLADVEGPNTKHGHRADCCYNPHLSLEELRWLAQMMAEEVTTVNGVASNGAF